MSQSAARALAFYVLAKLGAGKNPGGRSIPASAYDYAEVKGYAQSNGGDKKGSKGGSQDEDCKAEKIERAKQEATRTPTEELSS